jgi:hypothetical protein
MRATLLLTLFSSCAFAQWDDARLRAFVMDHRAAGESPASVASLLDAPAGKDGFIAIRDGHFAKPDGKRIRFWGVHFTDWSPGSVELPPKQDMAMWAATLARFGINIVRLHFLDLATPRGIIDGSRTDSQVIDPEALDRLDYEVYQLKQHGIYVDLNLNVGRSYKAGDGVADSARIQWGKGLTLFDRRLIELEKDYARQILTHLNPYTHSEYRNEPAVAIVELVNENGIYLGYRAPTPFYENELNDQFAAWLTAHGKPPEARLRGPEIVGAPKERYETEMAFFMDLEDRFYQDMSGYLKKALGVKPPILGTADHSHTSSPYPMLMSLSKLDVLDGHVYWEHPGARGPVNTPMVNDPLHSTIVQLSRTALAGRPYTVSEVNHPFPNDWSAEGIPILAAYGAFQDWDAIILYTFEPKRDAAWKPSIGDPFDISLDPVRMTQMAAGALLFERGDVRPAAKTVERSYTREQAMESRRLAPGEQPYFTPGFPLSLPLEHAVRIRSFDGPATAEFPPAASGDTIVSDTGELSWWKGLVTVDTERSQALIGFVKANRKALRNLAADLTNDFASVLLSSLDGRLLARSDRMLLSACSRATNSNLKWNEDRTRVTSRGESPTLIEPITGAITLRGLEGARAVMATALDGSGRPVGAAVEGRKVADEWSLVIGQPATVWYAISVQR